MAIKTGSISNIKGATVFIDKNGDGIWNEGEVKGIADDSGVFSLNGKGPAFKGTLISTGGINMTTGLANTETFMAPKVTKVVNSLTTLVAQVAKDEGLSMGQAMSQVKDALGIKLNILSKDPAALAESGKAGSAAVTNALAALEAQKQIDTVLKLGASTLSGAATGTDATTLKTGLLSALVSKVVSGSPLDLTSNSTIQTLLTSAATSAGLDATAVAKVTTLAADAASVIAASTTKIATSIAAVTELGKGATTAALDAALTKVVNVETVAATVSGALQSGAAGGSLSGVVGSYTGTALDGLVVTPPAPPTGPVVVPPVTPPVTPPSGGGGGGGGDTTPPNQPTLTTSPGYTDANSLSVEVNGEAGATIWVNGTNTGATLENNGKSSISLDTSGADGAKNFAIVLKDASGNASGSLSYSVTKDTQDPGAHGATPISVNTGGNNTLEAGDTITIKFSEPVKVARLTNDNGTILNNSEGGLVLMSFAPNNGGEASLGDNPTIAATDASNGYASTFTITLGANTTMQAGGMVKANLGYVEDRAGNHPSADIEFNLPTEFTVTNNAGTYTVGTSNGNVVVTEDGTNYVFTPATGTAVSVAKANVNSIVVNSVTLTGTAAVLNGETISGTGTVAVTAMESTLAADLSNVTATNVTAAFTLPTDNKVFTGKFGQAAVSVGATTTGTLLIGSGAVLGTATFTVASGTTLAESSGDAESKLSGKTITGNGNVSLQAFKAGTDASYFASTLAVTAVVTGNLNVSANNNLSNVDGYSVLTGNTLTLTASQAVGKNIYGAGGVTITGAADAQTFNIATTGTNSITPGAGADQVTLGAGTDTVKIAAGLPAPGIDGTDTVATGSGAKISFVTGTFGSTLNPGDVISFKYNDVTYTRTWAEEGLGASGWLDLIQKNINLAVAPSNAPIAQDAVLGSTGMGNNELVLTAVDRNATLTEGALTNTDKNTSVMAITPVNVSATAAFTTYTGIKASITEGDAIAFTYNGTDYTATVGALSNTQDATILTAINTAIANANTGGVLGADKVTATFSGTNLVLTAAAVSDTLVGGDFTDVTASDSALIAYDIITGFSLANDKLDLPEITVLTGGYDDTQTGVMNLDVTSSSNGVVTFGGTAAATATVNDMVQALLTAMSASKSSAAFVVSDGNSGFDT
ncbi:hypothetical protein MASR1M60_04160 [Rhodocyclaceae bacterium]